MKIAIASWLMAFDGEKILSVYEGAISGEAYCIKQLYQEFTARGHEVLLLEGKDLNKEELEKANLDFLLGFTCWQPLPTSEKYLVGYYHVNYWYQNFPSPDEEFVHRTFLPNQWAKLLTKTQADIYFTNSPLVHEELVKDNISSYLVPLFSDVEYFQPGTPETAYSCDVCYLGGYYTYKGEEQIEDYLVAASEVCNFKVFGKGWESHPKLKNFWGGILPADDIPKLYSSSAIVVNFNAIAQQRTQMMNNRFFEAISCGAYVVNDPNPWAEKIFGDLVTFTAGGEELKKLLPVLLVDKLQLKQKALQAREIVKNHFTPKHIVDLILNGYSQAKRLRR